MGRRVEELRPFAALDCLQRTCRAPGRLLRELQERAMAKPANVKIRLVSTADTGFFYVTKKNPRNTTEKMSFRKYDPVARQHVEFKERLEKSRDGIGCAGTCRYRWWAYH